MTRRPPRTPTPAKSSRVPKRLRAIGGVDPRTLPPGTAYPCDDPRIGTRGMGKRVAGTILACATPPEGQRGAHFAVGEIEKGSTLSREARARQKAREALRDRYSGEDIDARPPKKPRAPAAPREKVHRGEVVDLRPPYAIDPRAFDPRERGAANDFDGLRHAVAADVRVVEQQRPRLSPPRIPAARLPPLSRIEPLQTLANAALEGVTAGIAEALTTTVGHVRDAARISQARASRIAAVLALDTAEVTQTVAGISAEVSARTRDGRVGLVRVEVPVSLNGTGTQLGLDVRVGASGKNTSHGDIELTAGITVQDVRAAAHAITLAALRPAGRGPRALPMPASSPASTAMDFKTLVRTYGALPSATPTRDWLQRQVVFAHTPEEFRDEEPRLHVHGDALNAMAVAFALGNLFGAEALEQAFRAAWDAATTAAHRAGMKNDGSSDGVPVLVTVRALNGDAAKLSFTRHGEHFDVRAASEVRSASAAPTPPSASMGIYSGLRALRELLGLFDDAPRGRVVSERDFPEALTLLGAPPQVPSAVLTPSVLAKLPWSQLQANESWWNAEYISARILGSLERAVERAAEAGVRPFSQPFELVFGPRGIIDTVEVLGTVDRHATVVLTLPPRASAIRRRDELPLPMPASFVRDPAPTPAAAPVGEMLRDALAVSAGAALADDRWSAYQRAIFDFVANGAGNVVIEAVAGSGKSTTIVEAVRRIPTSRRVLILAFNVSIKDELKEKFRDFPNVEVRTLNGHAFRAMAEGWKPIVLPGSDERAAQLQDEARFNKILRAAGVPGPVRYWKNLPPAEQRRFQADGFDESRWQREVEPWGRDFDRLKNLIELCRGFLALTPEAIHAVQTEYNLLLTKAKRRGDRSGAPPAPWSWYDPRSRTQHDARSVIAWVQSALRESLMRPNDGRVARFDSVFPVAMLDDMRPEVFDWIFVDETQDMDTAQLTVVQKSVAPGGRVAVVGDGKQAIYGFRGADVKAMSRMESALSATRLPLSVSYRVPQCSARLVQRVVPWFEVPPGTPEGTCEPVPARQMVRRWQNGDFVISRTNAPLIPLAIMAIQQGMDVVALGLGDIKRVLKGVVRGANQLAPGWRTPEAFREAVERYGAQELARLVEEERRKRERYRRGRSDEDLSAVIDDLPAVKTLRLAVEAVQTLVRNARTPEEIEAKIDRVSYGGGRDADVPASVLQGKLVFTTVHKIKGAESPRTWVLDETFGFRGEVDPQGTPRVKNGDTMTSNARQEEVNLWYVAVTRVKNQRGGAAGELYFVRNLEQLLGGGYVEEEDEEPRANPARRRIAHPLPARRVPPRPLRRVFGR
jgi:hypothetical protein